MIIITPEKVSCQLHQDISNAKEKVENEVDNGGHDEGNDVGAGDGEKEKGEKNNKSVTVKGSFPFDGLILGQKVEKYSGTVKRGNGNKVENGQGDIDGNKVKKGGTDDRVEGKEVNDEGDNGGQNQVAGGAGEGNEIFLFFG